MSKREDFINNELLLEEQRDSLSEIHENLTSLQRDNNFIEEIKTIFLFLTTSLFYFITWFYSSSNLFKEYTPFQGFISFEAISLFFVGFSFFLFGLKKTFYSYLPLFFTYLSMSFLTEYTLNLFLFFILCLIPITILIISLAALFVSMSFGIWCNNLSLIKKSFFSNTKLENDEKIEIELRTKNSVNEKIEETMALRESLAQDLLLDQDTILYFLNIKNTGCDELHGSALYFLDLVEKNNLLLEEKKLYTRCINKKSTTVTV